jgi:hypothetical protein
MLEQNFQTSQTELARQFAETRKNNEQKNKDQIKKIEETNKAQIEALTKAKAEAVTKAEAEKNVKLEGLENEKNNTLAKLERERTQKKWESEVAQFRATKAAKTAEIIASTIASAAMAFAALASIPFVGIALGAAAAATITATGFMRVRDLGAAEPIKPPELELGAGGVMGGAFSHASGNDIPARIESGEAVIDRRRTSALFDAIDSGTMSGGRNISIVFESGAIQSGDLTSEEHLDKLSYAVVRRIENAGGFA